MDHLHRPGVCGCRAASPAIPGTHPASNLRVLARIRTQLSTAHERQHLDAKLQAFAKVGAKYGILGKGRKEIVETYGG